MIVDNLTKLIQKKKLWMTPKHSLYTKSDQYKVMYGAAVFMQAELNCMVTPLSNFELERLLSSGFQLVGDNLAKVLQYSKKRQEVLEYLQQELQTKRERYLLLLDILNVSYREGELSEREKESIHTMAKVFQVSGEETILLMEFIKAANEENVPLCREILHRMHLNQMDLSPLDLKYYITRLWETMDCTNEMLQEQKIVRIVDRCRISQDIVLHKGMKLILDHAEVRVYGNILLDGGELQIEDSKVIRKGDAHRACINIKSVYSTVVIKNSQLDCRNMGMLVRAEAGKLEVVNCTISHTTKGAAIRFWGNEILVDRTTFSDCYSPEDGGAIMIRTPNGVVKNCRFVRCEAQRGGALFAVEGNQIHHCEFYRCCVAEFGAAIFYHGLVRANVHHLGYRECCPEGAETVQYISRMGVFQITGEYRIMVSTILDCPLIIESQGNLSVENANVYLNYPIRCRGNLQMKNVKIASHYLKDSDMIILEHSKGCRIHHCEFNGRGKTGGIYASGCRITISKSLFRNMSGGRAIYDAFAPEIRECIFNFCQNGAIWSQNGNIKRCVFVNCRGKSGGGVMMYGNRGTIEACSFRRCVAEYSGGGIDKTLGTQIIKCSYEGCKPSDVS